VGRTQVRLPPPPREKRGQIYYLNHFFEHHISLIQQSRLGLLNLPEIPGTQYLIVTIWLRVKYGCPRNSLKNTVPSAFSTCPQSGFLRNTSRYPFSASASLPSRWAKEAFMRTDSKSYFVETGVWPRFFLAMRAMNAA